MSAEQHWCYRVAKVIYKGETFYEIREYYTGMPDGPMWSEEAEAPVGADDIDDLILAIRRMARAARKAQQDPGLILELDDEGDTV